MCTLLSSPDNSGGPSSSTALAFGSAPGCAPAAGTPKAPLSVAAQAVGDSASKAPQSQEATDAAAAAAASATTTTTAAAATAAAAAAAARAPAPAAAAAPTAAASPAAQTPAAPAPTPAAPTAAISAVSDGGAGGEGNGSPAPKSRSGKRKYVTTRKRVPHVDKPQVFMPIERLLDGSAFGVLTCLPDGPEYRSCCARKCNEAWDRDALERTRARLPKRGRETQTARKIHVRECFSPGRKELYVRDGPNAMRVCWTFFRALMGVSFNLIRSAGGAGPVSMKKRDRANTAADRIERWLAEVARHFEPQLDGHEVHLPFPTKRMVYNIFCETTSCRDGGGNIPSYQTFIASWNQTSGNIKLTKGEHFSKRDVRAVANKAINMARAKGCGSEWLSDAMSHIRRSLDGDDEELRDQPLMKGSSDESTRTERRPGEGGQGLPTDWSAEDRKPDVAEILEAEATTIDIAEQAEKTAVAIAASCAAPPALRVIADEPAVTAAGFATVPVRPAMASP